MVGGRPGRPPQTAKPEWFARLIIRAPVTFDATADRNRTLTEQNQRLSRQLAQALGNQRTAAGGQKPPPTATPMSQISQLIAAWGTARRSPGAASAGTA